MEYPEIKNKLTWEKINAFPIKNKDMSIREMRQLCVDFFRFNKTVLWTPNKEFTYIKSSKTMNTYTIEPGKLYGGFPYAMGTGNCYRLMDYIDPETGVLKIRLAAKCFRLFASQCSIGAYWGWGRVINSADYRWTYDMCEKNGFLLIDNSSEWVNFTDFLANLPTTMSQDYEPLLDKLGIQEMKVNDTRYYFDFTSVCRKGNVAPLEVVSENIRRILHTQRRSAIIKGHEQAIFDDAMEKGHAKIYKDDVSVMATPKSAVSE